MSNEPVKYHASDGVGVLTLNQPDQQNRMSPALLDAFAQAVRSARLDTAVRCIVITGSGTCFSAGADLRGPLQREAPSGAFPHETSYAMYTPFLSVLDFEVPTVAALNGHAVGGGFGLALLCDLRIASRQGKYGANFVRLGLHPGLGITYLLPRLVGLAHAADLLFTGRLIDGDEAARMGLVNEALDPAAVLPRARAIAESIAQNAPGAVRLTKRSLRSALGWDTHTAALREAYAQAATLQSDEAREGVRAQLEKRAPRFGKEGTK